MRKEYIEPTVKQSDIRLREGTDKLIAESTRLKIPLLIFSAGLSSECIHE
jgi:hypothetical protein